MKTALLIPKGLDLTYLENRIRSNFAGWDVVFMENARFNMIFYFAVKGTVKGNEIMNLLKVQLEAPKDVADFHKYDREYWLDVQYDFGQQCVYRTQSYYLMNGFSMSDVDNFKAYPILSEEYEMSLAYVTETAIKEEPISESSKD